MNFCTLQDVENFLQIQITDADQILSANAAIRWATEAIKNWCHQVIERVTDEVLTLDVMDTRYKIFLPELPVISVARVVEDGELLVVDDDYKLAQYGVLHRVDNDWAQGIQIVEVTYTHGYSTIPDDVVAVCARAASREFQAGLRSAELAGLSGVASFHLGDYTIAFGAEGGGGVSEGVMGASAARMLLLSEKDMLARYRYVAQ